MGDRAAKRGRQSNHGSDVVRPLSGYRTREQSSEAMADEVNLSLSFGQGPFDRRVQMTLDQQVRALGIDRDTGKIGAISDAPQPTVELHQIKVGAEETGNDDDGGSVTVRYAESVINRGGMQQEDLGGE